MLFSCRLWRETTAPFIKMFVGIKTVDNSQHMGIILMNRDWEHQHWTRSVRRWRQSTFTEETWNKWGGKLVKPADHQPAFIPQLSKSPRQRSLSHVFHPKTVLTFPFEGIKCKQNSECRFSLCWSVERQSFSDQKLLQRVNTSGICEKRWQTFFLLPWRRACGTPPDVWSLGGGRRHPNTNNRTMQAELTMIRGTVGKKI